MVVSDYILVVLILAVAFMYASVGHGGASGYLALMALFNMEPSVMKPSALLLNVFVAGIAFILYARAGFFRWKIFLPFALASVPAAYFGALLKVDATLYKIILGICLLIASARMLFLNGKQADKKSEIKFFYAFFIGGLIGFLSGMIGIGGGIILSPVLILFHWSDMKETAAVSSLFIFVNSISGLLGIMKNEFLFDEKFYFWIGAAIVGGMASAYLGSKKFHSKILRYALALVLCAASVKLFFT